MKNIFLLFLPILMFSSREVEERARTYELVVKFSQPAHSILDKFADLDIRWYPRFLTTTDPRLANWYRVVFSEEQESKLTDLVASLKKKGLVEKWYKPSPVYRASIRPNQKNDSYFYYQWYLENTGQSKVLRYTDEYYNITQLTPGRDIQYTEIRETLVPKMIKKVRVAVIDSGVDVFHPNLKDHVYKHNEECMQTDRPRTKEDPFPDDCQGWDTTVLEASNGNRGMVDDYVGHGTHIAGIIASGGYGETTLGIVPEVEILPIKVYRSPVEKGSMLNVPDEFAAITLSSYVEDALEYAIWNKADIINMSFGWPPFAENTEVKVLLEIARKKGIVVVAAAGNDSSFSQVFPCSYESVVCVGSMSDTGKLSDFSNFGSHIDFLAPGEDILSTFTTNAKSLIFPIQGYEYLTGTSQAAPIISSFFAIARGILPDASSEELYGKMYWASSPQTDLKSLRGLPQLVKILNPKKLDLIIPTFKEVPRLKYQAGKIEGNFKLKSYSESLIEFSYTGIMTDKYGARHEAPCKGELKAKESYICNFSWDVESVDQFSSIQEVEFILKYKTTEELFKQTLHTVNFFEADRIVDLPGLLKESKLPKNYRYFDRPEFNTALDLNNDENSATYFFEETRDGESHLNILEVKEKTVERLEVLLEKGLAVLQILVKDFDSDGATDLLLMGEEEEGPVSSSPEESTNSLKKNKKVFYLYLDRQGKPLFGKGKSKFYLENSKIFLNSSNIFESVWVSLNSTSYGSFLTPVFWGDKTYHKEKKRFGDASYSYSNKGIFYFQPEKSNDGNNYLKPVLLDNSEFYKDLHKSLKDQSEISTTLQLFPQSKISQRKSEFSTIVASGKGLLTKYTKYHWGVDGEKLKILGSSPWETEGLSILRMLPSPMIDINTWDFKVGYNFYADEIPRARVNTVNENGEFTEFSLDNDFYNRIFFWMSSYRIEGDTRIHFATSEQNLFAIKEVQGRVVSTDQRKILKNTLVPFASFVQKFIPVIYQVKGKRLPAVLVEESLVEASQFHLVYYEDDRLVAPASLKFNVPLNCSIKNPMPIGKESKLNLVLLCEKSDGNFELQFKVLAQD